MQELEILKELTGSLPPPLTDFTRESLQHAREQIVYAVEGDGVCFGFGLLHNPLVAVQHAVITEGATFPRHRHDENEFLIPIQGRLRLLRNGAESQEAGPGGVLQIKPGEPHRVIALSDCWMIGVLVPAGGGYPDAGSG